MTFEESIPWLILLGLYLVSTGILLILKAMKKIDLALFWIVWPGVSTVSLFLLILFLLFDNNENRKV